MLSGGVSDVVGGEWWMLPSQRQNALIKCVLNKPWVSDEATSSTCDVGRDGQLLAPPFLRSDCLRRWVRVFRFSSAHSVVSWSHWTLWAYDQCFWSWMSPCIEWNHQISTVLWNGNTLSLQTPNFEDFSGVSNSWKQGVFLILCNVSWGWNWGLSHHLFGFFNLICAWTGGDFCLLIQQFWISSAAKSGSVFCRAVDLNSLQFVMLDFEHLAVSEGKH